MTGVYTKKSVEDVFDTSQEALPFRLQQIAEDELGETPARRKESLAKLLQLLSEEEDLNTREDAQFLLRFLRVRKYNVEAALRTVKNYYKIRNTSGPVFRDFLPSKVSPATRKLMMVMKEKDAHGRRIFFFKPGMWVLEESSYVDVHRAIMLCLEHLARDPTTQTLGVVILFDYGGFTAEKVLAINVGLIRRGFEYLQDCMPMRLKAMHNVKQGLAFDTFFTLIRPFLKAKLAQRFILYGEKFEDLHKEIPPKVLPEEYGGQAPPVDFEGFWNDLESYDDEYRENNSYGYTKTTKEDFATEAEIESQLTFL
ncbi:alpha-tocopherol transfer protein-like [Dermacentor andersoni]|uniref:alpha-tocopherol transfer protein-like n=1 Tax=Dermacentor andersoni TaxID=34620 RepID=UPI002155EAB8|nr:alpha-tocopherol transfer protein-like [Dermacentor andersoni]